VTRDPAGFKGSPVPTLNPATALALLDRGGGPGGGVAQRGRSAYVTKRKAGRQAAERASSLR